MMNKARAIRIAENWSQGHVCTLRDGEAKEYHKLCLAALREQEQSKWISVKERLPEDVYGRDREQIVVLVCTKSGKVSQCARMADYECIADETLTKVEWVKNGKFYWSKNKAVTHWMPLPEPPKEGAD